MSIKRRIIELLDEGCSRQVISSKLGITLKATQSIIDRMKKKGQI